MATHFFWDPIEDNIIQERDDTGTVTGDYTTEPNLYGDLISQRQDGASRFYCFDGQGNTLKLTDAAGDVTDTYAYTAFGEATERSGVSVNPLQYAGREGYHIGNIPSQVYVRRRQYSSFNGRWLAQDPLGQFVVDQLPHELNRYQYCRSSPLLFHDPSGLLELTWYKGPEVAPFWNDFCGLHRFTISIVFTPKKYSKSRNPRGNREI